MNLIKELIFDLDGTLWDNTLGCAQTINEVLFSHKLEHLQVSREDTFRFMGLTPKEIGPIMFPSLGVKLSEQILQEVLEREVKFVDECVPSIYPGVKEKLNLLSLKYRLFIVSNCQKNYLETFLNKINLALGKNVFCDWECYGNSPVPKGENIQKLLQRSNITHPVYIGDTQKDFEAANFCQIPFYFVSYGFGSVRNEDCDLTFSSFSELAEHFLNKENI